MQSITMGRQPDRRESAATISTIAHTVKEPLQAIVGRIDLLRLGRFGALEPDQLHAIDSLESATADLERGIEAVVTLLLQRVGPSTSPKPIQVGPTIGSVLARLERQGVSAGVRIVHDLPDRLPAVRGRRPIVERLLDGLIREAMAGSRELEVGAAAGRTGDRGYVHIELRGTAAPDRSPARHELASLFELLIAAEGGRLDVRPEEAGARAIVASLPAAGELG